MTAYLIYSITRQCTYLLRGQPGYGVKFHEESQSSNSYHSFWILWWLGRKDEAAILGNAMDNRFGDIFIFKFCLGNLISYDKKIESSPQPFYSIKPFQNSQEFSMLLRSPNKFILTHNNTCIYQLNK